MPRKANSVPRYPSHTTDADGTRIVRVPLANTALTAKLFPECFARIQRAGVSTQWTFNPGANGYAYVRCQAPRGGNLISIARIVMDAGAGQHVRYRDGDRTNLRRDNLYLVEGRAKAREAEVMQRRDGGEDEDGEEFDVPPVPLPPAPSAGA